MSWKMKDIVYGNNVLMKQLADEALEKMTIKNSDDKGFKSRGKTFWTLE